MGDQEQQNNQPCPRNPEIVVTRRKSVVTQRSVARKMLQPVGRRRLPAAPRRRNAVSLRPAVIRKSVTKSMSSVREPVCKDCSYILQTLQLRLSCSSPAPSSKFTGTQDHSGSHESMTFF